MNSIIRRGGVFDDLLKAFFDTHYDAFPAVSRPVHTTRIEKDDSWVLRAEVPGYTEDDIKVEVKDGTLTISGKQEVTDKTDSTFRSSISQFSESFLLYDSVKADDISAELKSGILVVTVPKAEPDKAEPKQIPIKT